MPRVTVGTENSAPIEIHYEDHGTGQPVVLIHGYPLDGNSWERQERALLAGGYRVISYDRRGFGRSSQPTVGYDYDTFAADLNALLEHLAAERRRPRRLLDGHRRGDALPGYLRLRRVRKAALLGAIPPFLLKTEDNPEGVDGQVFEDIKAAIVRTATPTSRTSSTTSTTSTCSAADRISEQAWQASFNVAAGASPYASYACVDTWLTDFRADLPKIDVPTLVVHGTEDRILPFEATAERLPGLIADLSSSPSRAAPTTSAGPTPTRSTRRCSSSSGRDGSARHRSDALIRARRVPIVSFHLDPWLPRAAVRTSHRRASTAGADELWQAAQGLRLSDTRALGRLIRWRIPGTAADQSFGKLLRAYPFTILEEDTNLLISAFCGRIWTMDRDYPALAGAAGFRDWHEAGMAWPSRLDRAVRQWRRGVGLEAGCSRSTPLQRFACACCGEWSARSIASLVPRHSRRSFAAEALTN